MGLVITLPVDVKGWTLEMGPDSCHIGVAGWVEHRYLGGDTPAVSLQARSVAFSVARRDVSGLLDVLGVVLTCPGYPAAREHGAQWTTALAEDGQRVTVTGPAKVFGASEDEWTPCGVIELPYRGLPELAEALSAI